MQHIVLARKWRPKKFADLAGQQHAVKILTTVVRDNRIHHAYLLTGTRGVGKTTIARIIAKALNCLNQVDGEPCAQCENCKQIDSGSFIDVIEIDAASNTGVDNIRELIDNARYTPTSGKYKIYIIDEVHMLSKSAFNAMLKTLEEPPAHVIFILATTDLQKVPPTILSRCLQLKLRNLLIPEIQQYLATVLVEEQEQFEIKALELIAVAANGSMRDALSILDQAIAFSNGVITAATVLEMLGLTNDDQIYVLLNALSQLDSHTLMQNIQAIYTSGADLEGVLQSLQQKLCELSIAQLTGSKAAPELAGLIPQISINDVQLYFEIAGLGLEQLKKTSDKYPVFVMTMLRMLAFNIGNNEEKNTILSQGNFKITNPETSVPSATSPSKTEVSAAQDEVVTPKKPLTQEAPLTDAKPAPVPSALKDEAKKPEHQETMNDPIVNDFTGNWFELITLLKDKLGALFPFVANSQLKSYTERHFEITVDKRYESAFNPKSIISLNQYLSEHFARQITIAVEFADNVNNTLKEKTLLEKQGKQEDAERAVHEDTYLIKILNEFSAKIAPGSIKPIG